MPKLEIPSNEKIKELIDVLWETTQTYTQAVDDVKYWIEEEILKQGDKK